MYLHGFIFCYIVAIASSSHDVLPNSFSFAKAKPYNGGRIILTTSTSSNRSIERLQQLLSLRAGSSQTPPPTGGSFSSAHYYPNPATTQSQNSETASSDDFYPQEQQLPSFSQDSDDPFHETVQERVDSWRNLQREKQAASTGMEESPRDDQGRLKLLTSVSKGSRALIFFVLMFRNIHLYETADQTFRGLLRLVVVTPLVLLFVGNMAGVVASFSSPSHSAKKRLKAILNLDKLLEAALILFYFCRLTIAPSPYTPRDIYVSNTLHSVFFILQCQAFTRLSWDDTAPRPTELAATNTYSNPSEGVNYDGRPPVGLQQRQQTQLSPQDRPDEGWYEAPPPRQPNRAGRTGL